MTKTWIDLYLEEKVESLRLDVSQISAEISALQGTVRSLASAVGEANDRTRALQKKVGTVPRSPPIRR